MISVISRFFGNPTDVRSALAIVAGVLTTVLGTGHLSTVVIAVVDGLSGLIVLVDTVFLHKAAAQSSAQDHAVFHDLAVRAKSPTPPTSAG